MRFVMFRETRKNNWQKLKLCFIYYNYSLFSFVNEKDNEREDLMGVNNIDLCHSKNNVKIKYLCSIRLWYV